MTDKAGDYKSRKHPCQTSVCGSGPKYGRGQVGYKSKALKSRQQGNPPEVIAYADKVNERLRRKYYKMVLLQGKKANVAKIAVARELACFMWGMMTGNTA